MKLDTRDSLKRFPRKPPIRAQVCKICLQPSEDLTKGVCANRQECEARQPTFPGMERATDD